MPRPDQPQIEVESTAGDLRITIPKTPRVVRLHKRDITVRTATMIAVICVCTAVGLLNPRDACWDAMWGTVLLCTAVCLFYSLRYPDRVNLFTPATVILHVDDTALTVTQPERSWIRRYAKDQVIAIRTERCAFSRCGKMVLSAKQHRRRFKRIIAVYAELHALADAAATLRSVIGPEKRA
jgi:hypothetical protein